MKKEEKIYNYNNIFTLRDIRNAIKEWMKEVDTVLHPDQASKGKNQGYNIDIFMFIFFSLVKKSYLFIK